MTDENQLDRSAQRLEVTVARLSVTVESLAGVVAALQSTVVSKDAHDGLVGEVRRVDESAQSGIKRNDDRWSKLGWFIGLAVGAALLGLVLVNGGGR